MSKVRICLLGAGRAGEVHGDVYKWNIPDSEIVAIVDEDRKRLDKLVYNNKKISDKEVAKNFGDKLDVVEDDDGRLRFHDQLANREVSRDDEMSFLGTYSG